MSDFQSALTDAASDAVEREFRNLAEFAPLMIWRAGTDRLCIWCNTCWRDFTGRSVEQELGHGWVEGIRRDDYGQAIETFNAAFEARRVFSREYRLRRWDGVYRWVHDKGAPLYRDGQFAGYFGSCVDVTSHREAEDRQRALVDELNHRVKNTLSVVQGLAQHSFTGSSPSETEAFAGRLRAVAAAHDLLAGRMWRPVSLRDVVTAVATPWIDAPGRITIVGSPVVIPANTAVTMSLIVHELCTNAQKYGALRSEFGRVSIEWTVLPGSPETFEFHWREEGGPAVSEPVTRGFGMRLIERAFRDDEDARAMVDFNVRGFVCRIRAGMSGQDKQRMA